MGDVAAAEELFDYIPHWMLKHFVLNDAKRDVKKRGWVADWQSVRVKMQEVAAFMRAFYEPEAQSNLAAGRQIPHEVSTLRPSKRDHAEVEADSATVKAKAKKRRRGQGVVGAAGRQIPRVKMQEVAAFMRAFYEPEAQSNLAAGRPIPHEVSTLRPSKRDHAEVVADSAAVKAKAKKRRRGQGVVGAAGRQIPHLQ